MKAGLLVTLPALVLLPFQVAPGAGNAPYEPPVGAAEWAALDVEARWVRLTADGAAPRHHWLRFLRENGEHQLLEWSVVTRGWSAGGSELVEMKSPRWIRAACWSLDSPDSHTTDGARQALLARPALVADWLDKNPKAVRGSLADLRKQIGKAAADAREDSGAFLAALDPARVLRFLDAPDRIVEFGDRPRAQPGRAYLHQVQRAIDAMVMGGRFQPLWRRKLSDLTEHRTPAVRQAAYLGFSRLPAEHIPISAFLERARAASHEPERSWALLAFSYADHPSVFVTLHRIALDPDATAFDAAVSRLGDLGNGFTLRALDGTVQRTAGDHRHLLAEQLDKIRARVAREKPKVIAQRIGQLLERAAWAELHDAELAKALVPWTLEHIRDLPEPERRKQLGPLRAAYVTPKRFGDPDERARFRSLVRGWAAKLLD